MLVSVWQIPRKNVDENFGWNDEVVSEDAGRLTLSEVKANRISRPVHQILLRDWVEQIK